MVIKNPTKRQDGRNVWLARKTADELHRIAAAEQRTIMTVAARAVTAYLAKAKPARNRRTA
jgi:hypothetical protein